ncbi:MAG: hypothetical protein L0312_19630 [Acidobacteria bacterium]|nr:hypothetical protein [Acidobacteriota bacterium]
MPDAWGGSWGSAWGVSWGTGAGVVLREENAGGSKKRRQKRLFPSDEYPFDNLVHLAEPEKAHKGRVFVQGEQQESIAEEARLTAQMARERAQRDSLVAELRKQKELSSLAVERDRIARHILDIQQRARATLRRLERERNALRHKRKQLAIRLDQVRREQELEDMRAIAFAIGELYDD